MQTFLFLLLEMTYQGTPQDPLKVLGNILIFNKSVFQVISDSVLFC